MDELYASGIKLAYSKVKNYIFETGDETEVSDVQKNSLICESNDDCIDWIMIQKNASVLLDDDDVEENIALGIYLGENSKPLLCAIKDGVFRQTGLIMTMLHGDPLIRLVTEIIDHVVEAGIYNYWNSLRIHSLKLSSLNITNAHPLDGYYSFTLHHMQPAFYILLMGCCLSTICFVVEVFYNRVLNKRI
jgi:hypothetical protein